MMRNISGKSVVALALLLVLGVGGASAKDFDTKTITVNATVADRAELSCRQYSVALPPFAGYAYERQATPTASPIRCDSTHNRPVQLHVQISPLAHVEANTPIGTAVRLFAPKYDIIVDGQRLQGPSEGDVRLIVGPWDKDRNFPPVGAYSSWEFADSGSLEFAGPTSRPFYIDIWGHLQAVFQQPAGEYETEIILTVSD